MLLAPAFPPPSMTDPDDIGWAMCTAAAYWRQGRYDESLVEIALAAEAAKGLGLNDRHRELTSALESLQAYVTKWNRGEDADPKSIPVSAEYPSIEVLETMISMEELSMQAHAAEKEQPPVLSTLPSGIFGQGARPVKRLRYKPPATPLILDFEGSILQRQPTVVHESADDEAPQTKPSDRPRSR